MTATGFAFLSSPLLVHFDSPLVRTVGLLLRNVWLLLLVAILLTFLTGGRLRTRLDRVLVGVVAAVLLVFTPLSLMFVAVDGNLLLVRPDAQIAGAVDAVYRALDLPISVTVAAVVATRWRMASRPGRRALLPSVAGSTWLLFFMAVLTAGLVGIRLERDRLGQVGGPAGHPPGRGRRPVGGDPAGGSGLRGLADRVEALDGRLRVSSPTDGGTVVTAELPCRLPATG